MNQIEAFTQKLDLVLLQVPYEMPGNSFSANLIYFGACFLNLVFSENRSSCSSGFFNLGNANLFGNNYQTDGIRISLGL